MNKFKKNRNDSEWAKDNASYLGYTRPSAGILGALMNDNKTPRPLIVRIVSTLLCLFMILWGLFLIMYIASAIYGNTMFDGTESVIVISISLVFGVLVSLLIIAIGIRGLKINFKHRKSVK